MSTTSQKIIDKPLPEELSDEDSAIEQIKRRARARRLRAAQSLASRLQVLPDGSRVFLRFNQAQRIEHQVLLVSFSILAITGLLQRYSDMSLVGLTINSIFGGVDTMRTIHRLAAIALAIVSVYHMAEIAHMWFVKREAGAMWPSMKDFKDLIQMLKFNLSKTLKRPAFDRFTFEEKIEYWALIWGMLVMGVTGFLMWYSALATLVLPGVVVPISRVVHSLEAVLAVLSILIWHLYHTVIKEKNKSIFTGTLTEKEMKEAHPLEYKRILAAYKYLQKFTGADREVQNSPESTINIKNHETTEVDHAK